MNDYQSPPKPKMPRPRTTQAEGVIQAEIRLALGLEPDLVLWRNAIVRGEFWDPTTGRSSFARGGLPPGSSDLIGILTVHFGGVAFGRFFALEIKKPGEKPKPHQALFAENVRRRGGFAGWADSVATAKAALERARKGATS